MQKMDTAQKKRQQLNFRRKITIITADLHKAQKEQQSLAMEIRRFTRKRTQIEERIKDMQARTKKTDNEVRMLSNDLKAENKKLNRIS